LIIKEITENSKILRVIKILLRVSKRAILLLTVGQPFIFLPFRMRKLFKKLINHIFRSWEDEPGYTHPRLKILPPFFFELIFYLITLAILYQIGAYLWSII
jgi:hypothetical protein